MNILRSGEHEGVKLAVHGSLGLLAALCAGYNLLAYLKRREPHLALNTGLYGSIVAIEIKKCAHHLEKA